MSPDRSTLHLIIEVIIACVVFFLIGLVICRGDTQNPPEVSLERLTTIQENSVKAYYPHFYIRPIENEEIINCLIKYECREYLEIGNEAKCIGDSGLASGPLQFHKITFDDFSGRYKITLNYKSGDDQLLLADLMLSENINNIRHWSVYRKCLYLTNL